MPVRLVSTMTAGQRWVLVAFVASFAVPLVALTRGSDRPQLTLLFAVPLVAAVIVVPGFFRLVVAGSVIGTLAGFLAGGLGSRLAMRAIALMGGDPEVTIFGTFGVILFFIVEGALMGTVLAGLRLLRPMSARTVGLITGTTGDGPTHRRGRPARNVPRGDPSYQLPHVLWGRIRLRHSVGARHVPTPWTPSAMEVRCAAECRALSFYTESTKDNAHRAPAQGRQAARGAGGPRDAGRDPGYRRFVGPMAVSLIGVIGFGLIVWLMVIKPV